ncbi:Manganese peroxidase, partial [Lachnellula willkommii]
MYMLKSIIILATGASLASAVDFAGYGNKAFNAIKRNLPDIEIIKPRQALCPAVWTLVAAELSVTFLNTTDLRCNDDARAAIRAAFHDCASWNTSVPGGCDGSLILAPEELTRPENNGLQGIAAKLLALTQKYQAIDSSVTAADMIQFASSVAIVTCPLGPKVQTFVGRPDSSTASTKGLLPGPTTPSTDIITLFANKGISADELIALIGAHSASKQFHVDSTQAGAPQDDTPGELDVDFYADTTSRPAGVFVLQSDAALAADPQTSATFQGFVGKQAKWSAAFTPAMTKLGLLGIKGG